MTLRNSFLAKLVIASIAGAAALPALHAQSADQTLPARVSLASQDRQPVFARDQLNQLLGPVALYPDVILALMLPASTVPSDIVQAGKYLQQYGDPDRVYDKPWDNSVKSLARYPDVLKWMAQNLQWTTMLGHAFMAQPGDVMDAIQSLRAQAKAVGSLKSTPQMKVVQEQSVIVIQPAQPNTVYVPQYNPAAAYSQPGPAAGGPAMSFGVGFSAGPWLKFGCTWGKSGGVYRGQWRGGKVSSGGSARSSRWRPGPAAAKRQQQFERNYYSNNNTNTAVAGATPAPVKIPAPAQYKAPATASPTPAAVKDGKRHHDPETMHHDEELMHDDADQLSHDEDQMHHDDDQMHHDEDQVHHDEEQLHHDESLLHHDEQEHNEDQEHHDGELVNHDEDRLHHDEEQMHEDDAQMHHDDEQMHEDQEQMHEDDQQMHEDDDQVAADDEQMQEDDQQMTQDDEAVDNADEDMQQDDADMSQDDGGGDSQSDDSGE